MEQKISMRLLMRRKPAKVLSNSQDSVKKMGSIFKNIAIKQKKDRIK